MAEESITTYLTSALATSGTLTFAYPTGRNSADYDVDVATLFDGGRKMVVGTDFTVVLGASSATVTYLGSRTIAVGTRLVLGLGYRDEAILSDVNTVRVKIVSDSSYTLLEEDHSKTIHYTHAAGCTVTIPTGISASHCSGHRGTQGQVVFATSGTTLNNADSHTSSEAAGVLVTISGAGRNVFWLDGRTA